MGCGWRDRVSCRPNQSRATVHWLFTALFFRWREHWSWTEADADYKKVTYVSLNVFFLAIFTYSSRNIARITLELYKADKSFGPGFNNILYIRWKIHYWQIHLEWNFQKHNLLYFRNWTPVNQRRETRREEAGSGRTPLQSQRQDSVARNVITNTICIILHVELLSFFKQA